MVSLASNLASWKYLVSSLRRSLQDEKVNVSYTDLSTVSLIGSKNIQFCLRFEALDD